MDSFCHKYRKIELLNRSIVGIHHSKLLDLLFWIALKLYLHIRIVLLFVLGRVGNSTVNGASFGLVTISANTSGASVVLCVEVLLDLKMFPALNLSLLAVHIPVI